MVGNRTYEHNRYHCYYYGYQNFLFIIDEIAPPSPNGPPAPVNSKIKDVRFYAQGKEY